MAPDQRLKLPRLRWKGAVAYFDHGGKPRRWERLGTDPVAIQRAYDRIMEGRKAPAWTVDAMVGDYLAHPRAPLAPGTLANYRSFRGHLAKVWGHDAPETLTQADIVRYLRLRKGKTARGEIGLLSLAFVAWMDAGRLEFNPCFGVRVKLPASRRTRLLLLEEVERVLAAADERLALAIEIAYATGLRIGDLCGLRWADWQEGVQTRKTGVRQAYEQTDDLRGLLDRARALQSRVASLYVLCDRRGRPWTPDRLRSHWHRACAAAGVTDARFHDIRAAAGTEVERRHGRKAAQVFLGHQSEQTTETYLRDRRPNVITPLTRRKA